MILSVSQPAVRAWMPLGRHLVDVNALIGKPLRLSWPGMAECQSCGGVFFGAPRAGLLQEVFF